MWNKKLIISFIIALIAIIVVGFVAMNFVPTDNLIDLNLTDNGTDNVSDLANNVSDLADNVTNLTGNVTDNLTNLTENITNGTMISQDPVNDAESANDTNLSADASLNNSNSSSDNIDSGDILHKQKFTISENETGHNQGMEPGTYVMYYTENDGIIKVEKIA